MNIYDEDPTYKAQVSNTLAEPYPVEGFNQPEEEGFSVVFEAAASKAYDNLGLGSYKAASQFGQYGIEYTKLAQSGKLRAMGIDPKDFSMAPGLAYMKHKDIIEKYAADHPEEGITRPSLLEEARIADMKETEEHYRDVYSRASSLGKVGGFLGSVFGAMTDPVNLALTAVPTGLVAGSAASLLSQIPRIIGMSALGATAGSITSKYRDLQYRSDVTGEDTSKLSVTDIAQEIGIEAAIGTVVGTGLVAGGAAIGKALKAPSALESLAPSVQKDVTVTGEKLPQVSTEDAPYSMQAKQTLASLEEQQRLSELSPEIAELKLTDEQTNALHILREADEIMSQKPADVSQIDHAKEYADTRAALETPWAVLEEIKMKKDFGEQLTPAESRILEISENPNKRFEEGYKPSEQNIPEQDMVDLRQDEIDVTIDDFLVSGKLDIEDFSTEEIPSVKAFLEDFSSERGQLAKLTQCLLTPKPRIKL